MKIYLILLMTLTSLFSEATQTILDIDFTEKRANKNNMGGASLEGLTVRADKGLVSQGEVELERGDFENSFCRGFKKFPYKNFSEFRVSAVFMPSQDSRGGILFSLMFSFPVAGQFGHGPSVYITREPDTGNANVYLSSGFVFKDPLKSKRAFETGPHKQLPVKEGQEIKIRISFFPNDGKIALQIDDSVIYEGSSGSVSEKEQEDLSLDRLFIRLVNQVTPEDSLEKAGYVRSVKLEAIEK